jgi:hypothetical protein
MPVKVPNPIHRRPLAPLTARDFVYRYEAGLGKFYENGPYRILVGRNSYCATYRGQTFSWGLSDFLSAVEACACHEARRTHGSSRYTQRCQLIEEHGWLTSEQE